MMKEATAVILAGGKGERMDPITQHTQKCMLPIDGKPILAYILDNIETAFGSAHVIIAMGYKSETVTDYFKTRYHNSSIEYVHNPNQLETRKRLLLAENLIKGPFLYLAGDVISHPTQLLEVAQSYEAYGSNDIIGVIAGATDHSPALSHALITVHNGHAIEMVYPATCTWKEDQLREMGIAYYDHKFIYLLKQARPEQTNLSHVITEAIQKGSDFVVSTYFDRWYHFLRPEDLQTTIHFNSSKT